jgi:hypothetical protein
MSYIRVVAVLVVLIACGPVGAAAREDVSLHGAVGPP